MNKALIFSDNKELIKFCTSILLDLYQIKSINDLSVSFDADIILIDGDKISKNKPVFHFLNNDKTRFLIMGDQWSDNKQIEALVHGAAGYCEKNINANLLIQAIESILKGDIWIQRHLVSKVISKLAKISASTIKSDNELSKIESTTRLLSLSKRELEVAKMVSVGDSNKSIASSLYISDRTVKAHLTSIFKKLNISDRLHLALFIKEFK